MDFRNIKLLAAVLGVLLAKMPAFAAVITWQAPVAITSADQALGYGSVLYATRWGGGATSVGLSGGTVVSFAAGTIDGAGQVGVTGAVGIAGSNTAGYAGTSNAAFNAAVGGFAYDGIHTITLTGLTVGQSYLAELFSIDDRGCCGSKVQSFADVSGHASQGYAHNANVLLIGSFTADATSEVIVGNAQASGGCSGGLQCTNLNAVVVYGAADVPEPGSLALLLVGLAAAGAVRRRR